MINIVSHLDKASYAFMVYFLNTLCSLKLIIGLHVHILSVHAVGNLSCNWITGYVKIILLFCSVLYIYMGFLVACMIVSL